MAAAAVKAAYRAGGEIVNALVAVAVERIGAKDPVGPQLQRADAPQRVVEPAKLEFQLGPVAHVHSRAAAAAAEYGTFRLDARFGGSGKKRLAAAPHGGFVRLHDPHAPLLAGQRPRHENRPSGNAAYAAAVGGEGVDLRFIYVVFSQFIHNT